MTMHRAVRRIGGSFAVVVLAVLPFPERAGAAALPASDESPGGPTPLLSVEVPLFTGVYETGADDDPATQQNEARGTQRGYLGLYREGLAICNGSADRLPSPSETLGIRPFTLQGYIWAGPELASSNQTLGTQIHNLVGAGNNHRSNATATADPTGLPPCPGQNPDALND